MFRLFFVYVEKNILFQLLLRYKMDVWIALDEVILYDLIEEGPFSRSHLK